MHPPPSPERRADFTIMMECVPESGHCYSVYSVVVYMSDTYTYVLVYFWGQGEGQATLFIKLQLKHYHGNFYDEDISALSSIHILYTTYFRVGWRGDVIMKNTAAHCECPEKLIGNVFACIYEITN